MNIVPNKVVLNKTNKKKWLHNLLKFLRPVIVLYTGAVGTIIGMNGGAVRLEHFIPNSFILGGVVLYLLNTIQDYLNKLED